MIRPQPSVVQLVPKAGVPDVQGRRVCEHALRYLGIRTGLVRCVRIYVLLEALPPQQLAEFAQLALADELLHEVHVDTPYQDEAFRSYVLVARHPGVTDDEGLTAQRTLADFLGRELERSGQRVFSQTAYLFERDLDSEQLRRLAEELLGNSLINRCEWGPFQQLGHYLPAVALPAAPPTAFVALENLPDAELRLLSQRRTLSLNLEEMRAIRDHFGDAGLQRQRRRRGLGRHPTDCELEVLGQTWSEHCKHKEFNALIRYRDLDTGQEGEIDSLFHTFIRGSTERIAQDLERSGDNWLVKVFSDNAGVVRIDDERVFVWKVETHNTPSALDPYGGAITGILGNNRDPLGTGVGGGRLLFNTNVLCFGSPFHDEPLVGGQLHPQRIFDGVRHGIEDGGNKSGVPTVNGAIVFDRRYAGKPLVYCGTGAVMPSAYKGRPSWDKPIDPGDRILMAGGRVGKDGIHGATFSSTDLDENSPRTAVQIGSPITQKLLSDFLERACVAGLIKCCTDNGAGGLSSSVGELAPISGGAIVQLAHVPLKYPGLAPWEVFVSEAQERMTLVVEPAQRQAVFELARDFEVELTDIGQFTDQGWLEVRWDDETVALLDLDFLHNGVPRKRMEAEWRAPQLEDPELPGDADCGQLLLRLLGSLDICSREAVIRQYDHEVKGKTVLKPLMGPGGCAPQDAAVLRLDFRSYDGVAVSNGIIPRYGDIDPYWMSAGAFDEAIRQIIAVGGALPDPARGPNRFWTVNDNFCLPDSAWHPEHNPDGRLKLGKLVRMAQALYDMATFFGVPMTSGKDSMKNDFRADGVKISVPPTILYSMVARFDDVRRAVSSEFKAPGDHICLLGRTWPELGGSQLYRLFGQLGASVPRVRKEQARDLYQRVSQATEQGLLESCHDLSDGGLGVALAESCFGAQLGCHVELRGWGLDALTLLFSESHSRFLASVRPQRLEALQELLGEACRPLGRVTEEPRLRAALRGEPLLDLPVAALQQAWADGLRRQSGGEP